MSEEREHKNPSDLTRRRIMVGIGGICIGSMVRPAMAQTGPGGAGAKLHLIGTGAPQGTYHVYGLGMAAIMTEGIGARVEIATTAGARENLTGLQDRKFLFGMANMAPALEAYTGTLAGAAGQRMRDIRAAIPMFEAAFHMITLRDGGARSFSELAGKKIGIGTKEGSSGLYWPGVLKAAGIDATLEHGEPGEQVKQLLSGKIQGLARVNAAPIPFVEKLAKERGIGIVGLSEQESEKVLAAQPFLSPFTIPAKTYTGVEHSVRSVTMWSFLFTHRDAPDELIRNALRATFEQNARLRKAHPAGASTLVASAAANRTIPWHPAAARFYREAGVAVADIPSDAK